MKYYSTKIINDFIQQNAEKIRCIYVGMDEDWEPTAVMIYKNGEVLKKNCDKWRSDHLCIRGINGSVWATPTMKVDYKNGEVDRVPCFEDDGELVDPYEIQMKKMFAMMTRGFYPIDEPVCPK